MSNFFLAAFFLLFGVMSLVETKIPAYVLGIAAILVFLSLGWTGINEWRKKP